MVISMDHNQKSKRPMKKEGVHVAQREQTVEAIKLALEKQGIDYRQAFAVLALDERGNVRVPAASLQGSFHDQLTSEIPTAEPSRRGVPISEPGGIEIDADALDDEPGTSYDLQPSTKLKSRRIVRQTRQRGRSMLPRDASRFSCAPYPQPSQVVREPVAVDSDEEEPPVRPKKQLKSFRLDDTEQVVAFLGDRLKRMQQLADKKIAKAWIKGICPKKQAKYPYSNNKREQEEGKKPVVPEWWPDTNAVCRFVEPDHIRREERMRLCIHLLRLRPSLDEFRDWNKHDTEPSKTHVEHGWTAFLMELAGPEIFEDLPRESPEKLKMRQNLMAQMYDLATREEDYTLGGRDGSELFMYEEDEEERKSVVTTKRPRPQSVGSTAEPEDDRRSASASQTRVKRARQDSVSNNSTIVDRKYSVQHQDAEMADEVAMQPISHHSTSREAPQDEKAVSSTHRSFYHADPESMQTRHNSDHTTHGLIETTRPPGEPHGGPVDAQIPMWRSYDSNPSPWVNQNAAPYRGQQFQAMDPLYAQAVPADFTGRHDFEFPQYHQHGQNQVHHVANVPQPEFHTLPSTPTFSPSSLAAMPMGGFPMQSDHHLPQEESYTSNMPAAQYFMPAHADPSVADFHPPIHMQAGHYQQEPSGLAQRHITPMHHQGLPFTYPEGWQPQERR